LRSNAGLEIAIAPAEGRGISPLELEAPDVEERETLEWEDFEEPDADAEALDCREEAEVELGAVRSSGLPWYSEQSSVT
jgi:hypothetical protein